MVLFQVYLKCYFVSRYIGTGEFMFTTSIKKKIKQKYHIQIY